MVELMLVVAIIGVMATIMLPTFNRFQCRSKRTEAFLGLRAIDVAYHAYYSNYAVFPALLEDTDIDLPGTTFNTAYGNYYQFDVVFGWMSNVYAAIANGYEDEQGWYYIIYNPGDARNYKIIEGAPPPCQL